MADPEAAFGEDAPPPSLPPVSGEGQEDSTASTPESKPPPEPPSLETALTWLAKIKPGAVLALLREPDFALVSMKAFTGFRVNATGYANPLVRSRLAQEAGRNSQFADKLREMANAAPTPPFGKGEGPAAVSPAAAHSANEGSQDSPDQEAQRPNHQPFSPSERGPSGAPVLKVEKPDRGLSAARRERDAARQALAGAEAARAEATRQQQRAEAERNEAGQQSQKQAQRIARLERQVAKLQKEQADLLRALKEAGASPEHRRDNGRNEDEGRGEPAPTSGPRPDLWREAVAHLLDKKRDDLALSLAEDVLRAAPDDPEALEIAARAHVARGDGRAAVPLLRRLLVSALARRRIGEASEALLRLLLLAQPAESERDVRAWLHALRPGDPRSVEPARQALARLRAVAPERHRALAAQVARLAPAALAEALMPPPGQIGPDDPLPLALTTPASARRLIAAVDAGEAGLVERAREALARLCAGDPEAGRRVREALARAAEGDDSALVPLTGARQRGPVLVDGSNAAWHDQDSLASGRPRLRPLLALRRTLRLRGFFPVHLYADAPLPYTVDDAPALRTLVARGELALVDSGVDADEVLLREAKRLQAPLVTNDRMADWDPEGEVHKIRYTLSLSGEAVLLSE